MNGFVSSLKNARFAAILFVVLLAATLILTPSRFSPTNIGTTLGLVAPLILAAFAATPVILAGREGIDLSIGPLIGIIGALIVKFLFIDLGIENPLVILAFAVFIGLVGGALNGFLTVVVRIQPIVATLGTYLVFAGLASWYLPSPLGPVPDWMSRLSEGWSFIPILAAFIIWWGVKRTALYGSILAIGGDDRAAYASGVNVGAVRFICYLLGGIFAALAAISLTALLGSADSQVGPNYTLLAIAAAALGGVSLAGGKGGMTGAALGGIDIFLIQNLVTHFNVSPFSLQITYGLVLVIAVSLNSELLARFFTDRKRVSS